MLHKGAAPAKLTALLVLLAAVPLAALAWLAWGVLSTERAIERARQAQQLADSAKLVASELTRTLDAWQDRLDLAAAGGSPSLPPGTTLLSVASGGVTARNGAPMAYVPVVAPTPELPRGALAVAEAPSSR